MDYSGKSNRIGRREKQKSKKQPYSSKHVRTKENLLNKTKISPDSTPATDQLNLHNKKKK